VIQILTHGICFDRSYWDLVFNNYNYSYVEIAVDQYGFSTLSWDKIGIANSSHGSPLSGIQAPLELAALTASTQHAKDNNWTYGNTPSKIVHVGHSFG
jgi:hypothetical protein